MTQRINHWLFLLCRGLLYIGPMFAGLAGYGWKTVPMFVALFMIWLAVRSPNLWPKTLAGWKTPYAITGFIMRLVSQIVLVVFCFAIGRGIGGVLGALPALPLGTPFALTLLSIPLSRLLRPEGEPAPQAPALPDQAPLDDARPEAVATPS